VNTVTNASYDRSQIAAIRKSWIDAVIEGDVSRIEAFVTDDIVTVRGNGQCLCGKGELKKCLEHLLGLVDVQRTKASSELIMRDHWAIEIDEVESTRATVGSDDIPIDTQFKAVFMFKRQLDGSWRIARVVELPG
jgi:ketosteroid isomerase-like protein